MKRAALFSVLSKKMKDGEITFIDSLQLEAPKTRPLAKVLMAYFNPKVKKLDLLMVPAEENKNLARAARNLPKTKVLSPISLNIYDLLNHKRIFIDKNAVQTIEGHYKI